MQHAVSLMDIVDLGKYWFTNKKLEIDIVPQWSLTRKSLGSVTTKTYTPLCGNLTFVSICCPWASQHCHGSGSAGCTGLATGGQWWRAVLKSTESVVLSRTASAIQRERKLSNLVSMFDQVRFECQAQNCLPLLGHTMFQCVHESGLVSLTTNS